MLKICIGERMSGSVIGSGYYSIPTLVLARRCYFVLTTLINKFIQAILAISELVSRTRVTEGSPIERSAHYILDLMPPQRFLGGGYSIPTIALANISQLVMTKLTDFSSNCVSGGLRMVLLTVSLPEISGHGYLHKMLRNVWAHNG